MFFGYLLRNGGYRELCCLSLPFDAINRKSSFFGGRVIGNMSLIINDKLYATNVMMWVLLD